MTKELLFWLCMFFYLIGGIGAGYHRRNGQSAILWDIGTSIFIFIALAVLGWAYFGQPLRG